MKKSLKQFLDEQADKSELEMAREKAKQKDMQTVNLLHYARTVRKLELIIALFSEIYDVEEDDETMELVKKLDK